MPKRADTEKETKFINYFCEGETQGNATQSAIKAGYNKDTKPAQMGAYLRKKLSIDIRKKNEEMIANTSSRAISVLNNLLESEQDSVKLNTAKLLLELGNFHSQNININVDDVKEKSDEELMLELKTLLISNPDLREVINEQAEEVVDESEQTKH
jgi:phage terminase small subunit|tara:strand:- start:3481 stop:3945 length:465 start_codon:yes stop_codon:yes gene_type:complete